MALELNWGSGSPFSWRAMLTLELKRLPYASKLLEFAKKDHKSVGYLKLNPRGKFGRTPEETGQIWRSISEMESYLSVPANQLVRSIFFEKGLEKTDEMQATAAMIIEELKRVDSVLADSKWLVGSQISAADIAFSFDSAYFARSIQPGARPLKLDLFPLSQNYPNIASWLKRTEEAIPDYEKTYPPQMEIALNFMARKGLCHSSYKV